MVTLADLAKMLSTEMVAEVRRLATETAQIYVDEYHCAYEEPSDWDSTAYETDENEFLAKFPDATSEERSAAWHIYMHALRAETHRLTWVEAAGGPEKSAEIESQILSAGREFLPQCATEVVDGGEATEEYWDFLLEQLTEMSHG